MEIVTYVLYESQVIAYIAHYSDIRLCKIDFFTNYA